MGGLSWGHHAGQLDRTAGAPKLMLRGAGSGRGHKSHGMGHMSPGDAALVALHLQALRCREPAQPGRTNWKGGMGNHFKGQSVYNLSC